jgi:glucose-1-phosphate adenylyltransferase
MKLDHEQIPVLILAGGQGNGLFPLTVSRPKPAVAFGSCRLVDFTLSNCRRSGLKDCVLLTQYKRDQLAAHVRKKWDGGFRCLSPGQGKRYRGTADAVYQNLLCLENAQHVLILAGDHVYSMDYRGVIDRHLETGADLTLSAVQCSLDQASSFGVVEVAEDYRVRRFVEKPAAPKSMPQRPSMALVSMGIYVFRVQTLVDALHRHCYSGSGYDFGYHIVPSLIDSARVYAHDFCEESGSPCYWRDVGAIDRYFQASMDFLQPELPFVPYLFGLPDKDAKPSLSTPHGNHCRISRTVFCCGAEVDDGVEIEDSVLLPGVRVKRGARLRRAIVDEGVQIPEGFTVGWDAEVDGLHHIVSPGGVVVVSHAPYPAREHTIMPGRPESKSPGRTRQDRR